MLPLQFWRLAPFSVLYHLNYLSSPLFLPLSSLFFIIELSFRAGDELCIIGFKDSNDKWRPVSPLIVVLSCIIVPLHVLLCINSV